MAACMGVAGGWAFLRGLMSCSHLKCLPVLIFSTAHVIVSRNATYWHCMQDKQYPRDCFIRCRLRVELKKTDGSLNNLQIPNRECRVGNTRQHHGLCWEYAILYTDGYRPGPDPAVPFSRTNAARQNSRARAEAPKKPPAASGSAASSGGGGGSSSSGCKLGCSSRGERCKWLSSNQGEQQEEKGQMSSSMCL